MGKKPSNTNVTFLRDPDLPGVEIRYSRYHANAFRTHTHEAFSIALIETGRTSFQLEGENYTAEAGHLAIIPSLAAHACNPDPESDMSYRLFYVDEEWLLEAAGEVCGQDRLPEFPEAVISDPPLYALFNQLYEVINQGGDRLEKESLLYQGLADLTLRHASFEPGQALGKETGLVTQVRKHIQDNLEEKVTLDSLSQLTGVSRCHLLRVFQQETGLPPHAFQNQLRVDRAKSLLTSGMALSQVAQELGFTDQSHFSRVFKQYTGATPRQYQSGTCVQE